MKKNSTRKEPTIILACSGASDLGEISDRVARKLCNNGDYVMKCLAMLGADDKPFIQTLQQSEILVIDGCTDNCGKKIMEESWLSDYRYIRLTDLGYLKDQTPVSDEIIDQICNEVLTLGAGKRVFHEKPVNSENCTVDNCDMFDFMSDHVGLRILHPGGARATRKLAGHLQPAKGMKVLDIACGKGRTAVYLARRYGCRVTGIDILEKSVIEAIHYAKNCGVDHLVSFQVADAQDLPFANDTFDMTIAQAMLILVDDPVRVAQEATRVLKPEGRSGWLELSWKIRPTKEFTTAANKEICAACIANVTTFEDWQARFKNAGIENIKTLRFEMPFRGMKGMLTDEGIVNGLKVMRKYMTNRAVRTRMKKLDGFFRNYPEYVGYGMYFTSKKNGKPI